MRKFNLPITITVDPKIKEGILSKSNAIKVKGQELLVQVDEIRDIRQEEKTAKDDWRETLSLLAESKKEEEDTNS